MGSSSNVGSKQADGLPLVSFTLREDRYSRPPISTDFKDSHRVLLVAPRLRPPASIRRTFVNRRPVEYGLSNPGGVRCTKERVGAAQTSDGGRLLGVIGANPRHRWTSVDGRMDLSPRSAAGATRDLSTFPKFDDEPKKTIQNPPASRSRGMTRDTR